jgi:hypothetical protein
VLQGNNPNHTKQEIPTTNDTSIQSGSSSGWVMFMNTNSLAKIYVNYPLSNPQTEKDNIDNAVYLVNSTSLTLLKSPNLFISTDYVSTQGDATVIGYTITARNNITGIFGIGFSACETSPFVVGMNSSQIYQPALLRLFKAENHCYNSNPLSGKIQGEQGIEGHHLAVPSPSYQSPTGETLETKTDKSIYHYRDIIHLTVDQTNYGQRKEISSFRSEYPGIESPCGTGYFDYSFLKGDHTNIINFDQLFDAKNDTLNVQYSTPYVFVSGCPGAIREIKHVTLEPFSSTAKIVGEDNRTLTYDMYFNIDIQNMYSKQVLQLQKYVHDV